MHSTSLQTTDKPAKRAPRRKAKPVLSLPVHLNFSFRDWLRQRTEPSRGAPGWTPLKLLFDDYVEWCGANDVPEEYHHPIEVFAGKLRAHDDREPQTRLIERGPAWAPIRTRTYELSFPRHLLSAIRVTG